MVLFLEISSLGFISKLSYKPFAKNLKSVGVNNDHAIFKCIVTAIRASYFIFCRRNKTWTDPELLNYTVFFYKNKLYKNNEAETGQKIRTNLEHFEACQCKRQKNKNEKLYFFKARYNRMT